MNPYEITGVYARQIFDSRANPTVEAEITLAGGAAGTGIVPSGASTGAFEAHELRDGGRPLRGKGVRKAIANIENEIRPLLLGADASQQNEIDRKMIALDGTENKSRLGANAILGCSMAVCHAAAAQSGMPLYRYLGKNEVCTVPVPMVQIIGGGAHAADSIDIQDFLAIPLSFASFEEGFAAITEVYHAAQEVFARKGKPLSIADEGGLWPSGFVSNEEGLMLLTEAICGAGYVPGKDIGIALDIASSEFYDKDTGLYRLSLENKTMTRTEMVDMLCRWADKYAIVSIEDGCSEWDWEGHALLTKRLGGRLQLIGDDLFTTNITRIREGVAHGACNAVLIKMNQIGTISETMDAIAFTRDNGYLPVISARSGETEDVTVVHLAVASGAGQLKVGSAARGERTAKWNEAIRIEQRLGQKAVYPSGRIFDRFRANR